MPYRLEELQRTRYVPVPGRVVHTREQIEERFHDATASWTETGTIYAEWLHAKRRMRAVPVAVAIGTRTKREGS